MGADSISGDKLGGFNLTLEGRFFFTCVAREIRINSSCSPSEIGHAECARFIKSFNVPVMMVGGGGYTV